MILVGSRSSVRVHSATGDDENEKWHDVSLMLMETIEPMDAGDRSFALTGIVGNPWNPP